MGFDVLEAGVAEQADALVAPAASTGMTTARRSQQVVTHGVKRVRARFKTWPPAFSASKDETACSELSGGSNVAKHASVLRDSNTQGFGLVFDGFVHAKSLL